MASPYRSTSCLRRLHADKPRGRTKLPRNGEEFSKSECELTSTLDERRIIARTRIHRRADYATRALESVAGSFFLPCDLLLLREGFWIRAHRSNRKPGCAQYRTV